MTRATCNVSRQKNGDLIACPPSPRWPASWVCQGKSRKHRRATTENEVHVSTPSQPSNRTGGKALGPDSNILKAEPEEMAHRLADPVGATTVVGTRHDVRDPRRR